MKKLLLSLICLALLALTGCTQKGQPLLTESNATARWQVFSSNNSSAGSYDVLSGSLRFGPAEATKRVTYTLWSVLPEGGKAKECGRDIRLEIGAGIGGTLGTLYITDGRMTLLLPKEGRVYTGVASDWNLKRLLGLSLPLSVQGLNDFLAGRLFSALDAPLPERYETKEDGGIVYFYKAEGNSVELTLDSRALPVRWNVQNGWDMEISYDDNGLPSKISGRIHNTDGEQRLVLLVKERRPDTSPQGPGFEPRIPAGFTVYSLD